MMMMRSASALLQCYYVDGEIKRGLRERERRGKLVVGRVEWSVRAGWESDRQTGRQTDRQKGRSQDRKSFPFITAPPSFLPSFLPSLARPVAALQPPHLPLDRIRTYSQTCDRPRRDSGGRSLYSASFSSPLFSSLVPRALSFPAIFNSRTPKWSLTRRTDADESQNPRSHHVLFFIIFPPLSLQGHRLLQVRRLPPEGRQRAPIQRE